MFRTTASAKPSASVHNGEQDVTLTMTLDQFDRVRKGMRVNGMPCAISSGHVTLTVTVTLASWDHRLTRGVELTGVDVSGEPPVWPLP